MATFGMSIRLLLRPAFLSLLDRLGPVFRASRGSFCAQRRCSLLLLLHFRLCAQVAARFPEQPVHFALGDQCAAKLSDGLYLAGVKLPVSPRPLLPENFGKFGRGVSDLVHLDLLHACTRPSESILRGLVLLVRALGEVLPEAFNRFRNSAGETPQASQKSSVSRKSILRSPSSDLETKVWGFPSLAASCIWLSLASSRITRRRTRKCPYRGE
jgi:hypothetical protein